MPSFDEWRARIRDGEIGRRTSYAGPFGDRLLCYADLTATGRALDFIERSLARAWPFYANTHTGVSTTGRVTTRLREEARAIARRAVHAGPHDELLFVGSGATAAVNKLVGLLGIRIPEPMVRQHHFSEAIPPRDRPVVLVGPYEHHSNELPWLETIAEVVEVGLDGAGRIDHADLARKAHAYRDRPLKIGAFSAASNVSGVLTDVPAVARALHAEGFLVVVDYAAAGPYVPIDMHPRDAAASLDAVVLSTHKLIGGPGASGILVADRGLFRTRVPERPGGGTVDYVAGCDALSVDYGHNLTEREEGGTPNIASDVRAGMALLLREQLGPARILEHETSLARAALARLGKHPRVRLLGPRDVARLPILSFNVEGLHHDLVATLLDHLFGIQNRAGCSCAGPYGHRLLGIDRARSEQYRRLIATGHLGVKPGWVRVSLPYYFSPEDIDFVLSAIECVADAGEAFVPLYRLGWRDGLWRSIAPCAADPEPLRLHGDDLARDAFLSVLHTDEPPLSESELARHRATWLAEARRLGEELTRRWQAHPPTWNRPTGRPDIDRLVWFRYVETDAL